MTKIECLNNITVCNFMLKDYKNVLDVTNIVLCYNINNFDALYYRAKALIALNNPNEALKCIKKALSIKNSKTLSKCLKFLESNIKKNNAEAIKRETEKNNRNNYITEINTHVNFNETENKDFSSIESENNKNNYNLSVEKNKTYSYFSYFRILKLIKIFILYFLQYIKKNKQKISIIIFIFTAIKRKIILDYLKNLIGKFSL